MYLLDTDTCSYVLREKPSAVRERLRAESPGSVATSRIVEAELLYGAERHPTDAARLHRLISAMSARLQVLDWDASVQYARLRSDLERTGTPIGNMDLLIAAHALRLGAVLVTNNVRHFERVDGLVLENWTER